MKRVKPVAGQLSFFDLPAEVTPTPKAEVQPEEVVTPQAVVAEAVEAAPEPTVSIPDIHIDLKIAVAPPEQIIPTVPTVTFEKNGKRLLVKPNDVIAADIWHEVRSRLKNTRMRFMQFFIDQSLVQDIGPEDELMELWRWEIPTLDEHPYKRVLQSYGVQVNVSPSLDGYMKRKRNRTLLEMAPFPCYASSTDDLTQCVKEGVILKALQAFDGFEVGKRYMVAGVTRINREDGSIDLENSKIKLFSQSLQGRAALSTATTEVPYSRLNGNFEDNDKFVLESDIMDMFPERIAAMQSRLDETVIGSRLFKHSRQDVLAEAVKRGVLISKEMRMGKSREALANAECKGSQHIAWIGPTDALVDAIGEFDKAGIHDYVEVTKFSDLQIPAKYHIMSYNFVKGVPKRKSSQVKIEPDALDHERRGQATKTWLRKMGEKEGHTMGCPHCGQLLERPIHHRDAVDRIILTTWTTQNGYVCRNPDCEWEDDWRKQRGLAWNSKQPVKHLGGYIDWDRKRHADCGDHVGRHRMCPDCGTVDSSWVPPIYKRIKKNYATVIVDEIHNAKDHTAKTTRAVLAFRGKHHIGLSGTPISNNLTDMYHPLMWIFKGPSAIFPYSRAEGMSPYKERFCENVLVNRDGAKGHYKTLPYPKNPVDLWNFLSKLVVRRTRQDPVYLESLTELNLKLPLEDPQVIPVRMVPPQALLMLNSIDQFKEEFKEYCAEVEANGHAVNSTIVIGQMSRMKIAATCPAMLNEKDKPIIYDGGDCDLSGMGGKGVALRTLVPAKIMNGKKVVILSDMVKMRELMAEEFANLNPVVMESGDAKKKREILNQFRLNELRRLLIAGPQQVNQGVDLSCADVLVLVDLMWKAAKQKQALARLMAPTSKERVVEVIILNSLHSIDEYIYCDFNGKVAGMEQALDKRSVSRTAHEEHWQAYVNQINAEQEALQAFLRETGNDNTIVIPDFMDDLIMERVV